VGNCIVVSEKLKNNNKERKMAKKSDYWTEEQITEVLYEFSKNSFDIFL
jgi:hypothetical protein